MALVPIRIDRTSKPPLGTPLRSDGHWSVQGLLAFPLSEGAGKQTFGSDGRVCPFISGRVSFDPNGVRFIGSTEVATGSISLGNVFSGPMNTNDFTLLSYITTGESFPSSEVPFIRTTGSGSPGDFSVIKAADNRCRFEIYQLWWLSVYSDETITTNKSYVLGGRVQGPFLQTIFNGTLGSPGYISGTWSKSSLPSYLGSVSSWSNTGKQTLQLVYNLALFDQQIASLSANPWQIYEPETVWIEVGGGAEAALFAGSIYGQSSASAQLSTAITIASQVVAAGSISGGINTAIRLATGSQGSASASALLTSAIRMAASAQGYGASTADLSTTIALAADVLAASSASGALSTAIRFGGALSGSSTTTAALTNAISMAAQAAGLGSISGQLAGTVAAALFAGTISGSSSASANLSTAVILAAAAQGSSTAQAALSTALELAAQVNGIGSATGSLGADISGLAGSLHGSSEAQATLATAIHLMGVAAGQCVVSGRLAEPVEILAQLRVIASDPLALRISVRDPLALRVTVQ